MFFPIRKQFLAVFFDLDGTLVDTEPVAVRVVAECLKEWGIHPEKKDTEYVTGRKWEAALAYLSQKYSFPDPLEKCLEKIVTRYRERLKAELVEVPGSSQAVRAIAPHVKLALVSGSHRQDILWVLSQLRIQKYFQAILGSEDYPESKPSPSGYLAAIQKLGIDPSQGLVFEDSSAGIQSAKTAGLKVVAISCTNQFQQDLSQADLIIPDFKGVDDQWLFNLRFR